MIKKRVKRRLPLVIIFLVLVLGVAVLLYPVVSNIISQYTAHTEIASYNNAVKSIDTSDSERLLSQAFDYNQALADNDHDALNAMNYESLLSVNSVMGYVDIPSLKIYLPIYHGTGDDVLKDGVGHMKGTSLPVGGESTHSVLAAHTGLPTAELFTSIDRMNVGDVFYIHVLEDILAYQVDSINVVLPDNNDLIQIVQGQDYVTLLTCTPYGINDHRLLVRGSRIPYTAADENNVGNGLLPPTTDSASEPIPIKLLILFWGTVAVVAVIAIVLLILFLPVGKDRKKEDNIRQTNSD